MFETLYFLRKYWKPLAFVLAAIFLVNYGHGIAERACKAAGFIAEITELKRQAKATKTVLERATEASAASALENDNLTKKVQDYEAEIAKDRGFILSDDDANSLLRLK